MKKRLALLALTVLAVLSASAQMIAYQVTTNVQGQPGTPTVVDLQGTVKEDLKGLIIDADGNLEFNSVEDAKGFPIGFDFGYNSQVMKYFLIATNGMIQLSPTETVSSVVHKNNVTVFTDSGNHDAFGRLDTDACAKNAACERLIGDVLLRDHSTLCGLQDLACFAADDCVGGNFKSRCCRSRGGAA